MSDMANAQMKYLIFFQGRIPTLSYFSEELKACAEERGITCVMLDAGDDAEENRRKITECAQAGKTVVLMFNNVMLEHLPQSDKTGGHPSLTVCNILVDHPINYPGALTYPLDDYHIFVVAREHVRFVRKYFPDVRHISFLPLGGIGEKGFLPYKDRDIDILYVGFCQEEPAFLEIPGFADQGRPFYETVIKSLIQNPSMTTEEAMRMWLDENDKHLSPQEFLVLYHKYGFRCELMVRRYYKQAIMRGLSESGLRVDIYGGGWEDPTYTFGDNIRFHEPVSPQECGVLTGRAKICLNIMPWFKDGSHDRIHTGMLNRAVVVTDPSQYLLERFQDEKHLLFYDMRDIPGLIEKLKRVLKREAYAETIADTGYREAKERDTWQERLSLLLSELETGEKRENTISGGDAVSEKKVSVVIPCHNVSKTVRRTWESLKSQTIGIQALECIFVDDASDDEGATWEVLRAIEAEEPESVLILQLPENRCLGGARNAAFPYVSGKYLMFLDADDTLRTDACEQLYLEAQETGVDLIQFRHHFVRDDDSGLPMPKGKPPEGRRLFDLSDDEVRKRFLTGKQCSFGCTNKFYRVSLIRKSESRFPEHRVYEEPRFVYPMFLYADKVLLIDEEYYDYYWHAGSIMTSKLGKRLLDHPSVQLELLEYLLSREELFTRYYREIETQFVFSFFCETILFARKYNRLLPIDFFHQMQDICHSVFPDATQNAELTGIPAAAEVLPMLSMEIKTEEELARTIAGT